ncbi:UNVERIFIED_ORG: ABC-type branched-subunit amino acid transport system ATPase component [Variovorax paradoxus]|nr:ABC-type branched-subunit amino acid transport system ATPase component [Variovorax paradoxus]
MSMLKVENLSVSYGRVRAVNGVSFDVREGDLVSLIGANGAGKSTLLKAVMGALITDAGEVSLGGLRLGRAPVEERVRRGMYLVPEKRSLFNSMTVKDNLELGTYANRRGLTFSDELKRIYKLFPILEERKAVGADRKLSQFCR